MQWRLLLLALSLATCCSSYYLEKLNRGMVAVPSGGGMLLTWRILYDDPEDIEFNLYRMHNSTTTRGAQLLRARHTMSNYLDTSGTTSHRYFVAPVISGVEGVLEEAMRFGASYTSVAIQQPSGGTTPDDVTYTYEANDGAVGDLDGDGDYDVVLKWQPTNAKDNSQSGYTGNTIVDGYTLSGTRLWRIDLGINIRAGAHYTSMVVFDLDSDGIAEVMMKTADGTVDGVGTVIGDSSADYRNSDGYILEGPEYLTVFNGKTGKAMATTNYLPARGTVCDWGDCYGNRVDRFLAGVAYVDGSKPSAIFARGYYTRAVIVAWDWRSSTLTHRWTYDSGSSSSSSSLYGQGGHWFSVADVNSDGKQDIIYGAGTLSASGTVLYNTALGHGDALHCGDFNPSVSGLEVYMVHESTSAKYGMEMHSASSGTVLWGIYAGSDIGRGMIADLDPSYTGEESWSALTTAGLRSATGTQVTSKYPGTDNFGIWWDGDLSREILDGTLIDKWVPANTTTTRLLTAYNNGATGNNGSKNTPVISADILGDWREEVILRNSNNAELQVYTTTYTTSYSLTALMQDLTYRAQVAGQNMGYNQPPHTGYFLGNGM